MQRDRLAVLMTCHNRRARTLACIRSVYKQSRTIEPEVSLFLVDDGSTDGTAEAVRREQCGVHIIESDGRRFWNGGMRLAFAAACQQPFEYFLWLNDDVELGDGALAGLLQTYAWCASIGEPDSIVVGVTRDPADGLMSYGGWRRLDARNGLRLEQIPVQTSPARCDTMNGNCVLVPQRVVTRVGELDPAFTHGMADMDYGFRARKAGCAIWVAPGYVGDCVRNSGAGLWVDHSLGVLDKWRRLLGPKGLPPREWFIYTRRHSGRWWPLYWLNPYAKFWFRALKSPRRLRRRQREKHSA